MQTGSDENDYLKTIWVIDVTVGQIGKQWYAVWSGWEQNSNTDKTSQHLYIAKLVNPYNKEWWIFYHSKKTADHGWDRDIRLQRFTWDEKGDPVFGRLLPAGTPVQKPPGEQ